MKNTNTFTVNANQAALEYTLYMFVSSCFHKAVCVTPRLEEKHLLRYLDQRPAVQDSMEKMCIRLAEFDLPSQLPAEVWDCMVNVRFRRKIANTDCTALVFDGGYFLLQIRATFKNPRHVLFAFTYLEEGTDMLSGQFDYFI